MGSNVYNFKNEIKKQIEECIEVKEKLICEYVDVIHDVGPGGEYLSHSHTLKHFRSEFFLPKLFNRTDFIVFEKSEKQDIVLRANEIAHKIMKSHQPLELDKGTVKQLDEIMKNIQLTKEPKSFLSDKYEYSTFIEHQRTLIMFFSQLKSLNRPGSKIGRKEILRGFIDWVDLVSEERVNTDIQHQQSSN